MTRQLKSKVQAIGYFLGTLSECEQSAVEERFFADEPYSRFLDSVEDELINDYVLGKLDLKQTQDFEDKYLISQRRRDKVSAAKILQAGNVAEETSVFALTTNPSLWQRLENLFPDLPSALAGGLASILFLISLGGLWLASSPENNQTTKIEREGQTLITNSSDQSLSSTMAPDEPSLIPNANQRRIVESRRLQLATKPNLEKKRIASFVRPKSNLSPDLSSPAPNSEKLLIVESRNTKNIRLRFAHNYAPEFASYRIEIHAADGDLLWSREIAANDKNAQKPLALNVRRGALVGSDNYGLTISGATHDGQLEEINFYNFSIQKK